MYVVLKKGWSTMELGVVMTRQNFGFHVLLRVLFVVSGQGGDRGRHERVDAKRGKDPTAAPQRERE